MKKPKVYRNAKGDRDGKMGFRIAVDSVKAGGPRFQTIFDVFNNEADAKMFGQHIVELVDQHESGDLVRNGGTLPRRLQTWITGLSPKSYDKLAAAGLVAEREGVVVDGYMTIEQWVKYCKATVNQNATYKASTKENFNHGFTWLLKHFDPQQQVDALTQLDAQTFRNAMISGLMAPSTINKIIKRIRSMVKMAKGKVSTEVFHDLKPLKENRKNDPRRVYVSRETIEGLILLTDNTDRKLILALARYGGLRCPNELINLTWGDVKLEDEIPTLFIRSSKTEHHEGSEDRTVVVNGFLLSHLKANRPADAQPGQHVVSNPAYRHAKSNNRRWLEQLCNRAKVPVWPKLFQNLRVSAENDIMALPGVTETQAARMIGHSIEMYRSNYAVTDEAVKLRVARFGMEEDAA